LLRHAGAVQSNFCYGACQKTEDEAEALEEACNYSVMSTSVRKIG